MKKTIIVIATLGLIYGGLHYYSSRVLIKEMYAIESMFTSPPPIVNGPNAEALVRLKKLDDVAFMPGFASEVDSFQRWQHTVLAIKFHSYCNYKIEGLEGEFIELYNHQLDEMIKDSIHKNDELLDKMLGRGHSMWRENDKERFYNWLDTNSKYNEMIGQWSGFFKEFAHLVSPNDSVYNTACTPCYEIYLGNK